MGFFSWMAQDTGDSISNSYSIRGALPSVTMSDNKGNKWTETDYEGYGVFGGKDYYELLDEMNGGNGERGNGISLEFAEPPKLGIIYPNLNEDKSINWVDKKPETCPNQGFFYDEEDEDEDENEY